MSAKPRMLSWQDFPEDFMVWKLNPKGCTLSTRELTPGVYVLLSSISGVNNTGFIVGEKGVLVIDAHTSIPMARQIQERVREVTDKPIRYLVNLNYHADHTFGNCAFPKNTLIIQQRETAVRTLYLDDEREFMLPAVANDPLIFEGVAQRRPDIVFNDYLRIDLGGQLVELHWFGPANTPGDTIAYVPKAKTAWTGNMTGGSFGLALESDAPTFLNALIRFVRTIGPETLIPAHGPILGSAVLSEYVLYFSQLTTDIKKALAEGWTLKETLERTPMPEAFRLPPSDARAPFMQGRHSYNVRRTYLSLKSTR